MSELEGPEIFPESALELECFGDGERVCPQDENGIMQPRQACVPCPHLRPCLQLVLHRRGKIRLVEEPASKKVTSFLKRWSDQKLSAPEKHKG
ncbi:MAG: hypothetical protein WAW37_18115 [Syntrophobacteraceae bacterium]